MNHHVITPLNRFENLRKLVTLLEPQKIIWHVIIDRDVPFRLWFEQDWIHCHVCPNDGTTFWSRCNTSINWLLDTMPCVPTDRYSILNDDDAYEPGYFDKLRSHSGDVIVTSMHRGNATPIGVAAERAHGTNTLVAAPENMKVGHVGVEQICVAGSILNACRLPLHIAGDGQMIEYICATNHVRYVPDAFVWFNYLEKGRWS